MDVATARHLMYQLVRSAAPPAMDETDAFFTRTVIGPPLSVVLGRRQRRIRSLTGGLDVDLGGPGQRLDQLWRDWLITSHQDDPAGLPRRRPGRLRRWLERHALAVALAGVLSLVTGLVLIGISTWK